MLSKTQIIDQITLINRSASRPWLQCFRTKSLARYLEHLHRTLEPRGGESRWIRQPETPAVVGRRALS